ncbi:MAG: FecR family protein [Tannerellaceae bacterium]|jgi:ferric-dicitrate binding protein FerR (iron transport regulator)|nr:FecR family protein [Tannerellaceae bacterium]
MENISIDEELIVRYLSDTATENECKQLLKWIGKNPENKEKLFILKDIHDAGALEQLLEEAGTKGEWEKFYKRILSKSAGTKKFSFLRGLRNMSKYAAIFVSGMLMMFFIIYLIPGKSVTSLTSLPAVCEIKTSKGERATVTLPDGSSVILNACSYLAYSSDFGEDNREIQFFGEAYFDVQTNPEIPFTVKTSGLNIKAYGTVFNIKAYEDEDIVETTLLNGIVSIETDKNQNIVTLKPNQVISIPKALVAKNAGQEYIEQSGKSDPKAAKTPSAEDLSTAPRAVLIDRITPEVYTSWKDDKWVFKSESLVSLAKKIERKFNVVISIDDNAGKYVFGGTIKDLPLEQVLAIIKLNAPIRYEIREKNIFIKEEKQLKREFDKLIKSPH